MPHLTPLTLSVPQHFIVPLLYGDLAPLDDTERRAFNRFLNEVQDDLGHDKPVQIGTVYDQPYFARWHDALDYGVQACMCLDVEILVEDEGEK